MPLCCLLERVPGAQDQAFLHMSSYNLEPDRQPGFSFAAGQGQCRMAAHVECRCQADPRLHRLRSSASRRHVGNGGRGNIRRRHYQQIDILEERIEL